VAIGGWELGGLPLASVIVGVVVAVA